MSVGIVSARAIEELYGISEVNSLVYGIIDKVAMRFNVPEERYKQSLPTIITSDSMEHPESYSPSSNTLCLGASFDLHVCIAEGAAHFLRHRCCPQPRSGIVSEFFGMLGTILYTDRNCSIGLIKRVSEIFRGKTDISHGIGYYLAARFGRNALQNHPNLIELPDKEVIKRIVL